MYKIMIVDDEKYIRLSIRNRIDWEKYGLEVVGEAGDGEEAYAGVQLYHPDIMLVDIRMPVLDGLGLIRLLRESDSHIRVIILSAYQDFDYAKKAIQLGVEDYLLKPIDEAELDKTLKRIMGELDHEEWREKFPVMDINHWQQAELVGADCCFVSCYLPQVSEEIFLKLAAGELYDGIKQAGFKSLPRLMLYKIKGDWETGVFSFLLNDDDLSENYLYFLLMQVLHQYGPLHKGIKCGISSVFQDRSQLQQRREESVQFLKYKMLETQIDIYDRRMVPKQESAAFTEARQILPILYNFSVKGEYEKVIQLSEGLIRQNLGQIKKISEIEYLLDEYLMILRSITQRSKDSYEMGILFHDFRKQNYILGYETLSSLQEGLYDMTRRVLSLKQEQGSRDVTKQIREYVQSHFMDNVTTKSISQKFHLNSTYLSTLFKEKTGMALTSYIEGVRMEHAAELLKNETFTIADVASAVGYTDTNYFGKVFKKYNGITPGQYRNTSD